MSDPTTFPDVTLTEAEMIRYARNQLPSRRNSLNVEAGKNIVLVLMELSDDAVPADLAGIRTAALASHAKLVDITKVTGGMSFTNVPATDELWVVIEAAIRQFAIPDPPPE